MTILLQISSLLGVLLLGCSSSSGSHCTCSAFVLPENPPPTGPLPSSSKHGSHQFEVLLSRSRPPLHKLFYSSTSGDRSNPLDGESSEVRQQRMELVRALQQQFYADEAGLHPAQHGIFQNMPIWRDNYTELPGSQRAMTVADPEMVHFLLKVVSHPRPWYYGHVYDETGEDRFVLEESSSTGTLLQISDYQLDETTGAVDMVVQSLGRISVVDDTTIQPQHGGYSWSYARARMTTTLATVELQPDEELVEAHYQHAKEVLGGFDFARNINARGAACAGAVEEAQRWHEYEFQPAEVKTPSSASSSSSSGRTTTPAVSSRLNYNSTSAASSQQAVHTAMEEYLSQSSYDMYESECSLGDDFFTEEVKEDTSSQQSPTPSLSLASQEESLVNQTLHLERDVWIELDKMARLVDSVGLKKGGEKKSAQIAPTTNPRLLEEYLDQTLGISRNGPVYPIPPQILDLLPPKPIRPWPRFFELAKVVRKRNRLQTLINRGDNRGENGGEYPALRRSRRLSYVVWSLLETSLGNSSKKTALLTKQDILEMTSISERLQAAKQKIRGVNQDLLQILEEQQRSS